jgi:hypothetical protein
MGNSIKYNAGATEPFSLKKGNFYIGTGDVQKGPSNFWNTVTPPTGGYTIYLNKPSNGPSIYAANNNTELIFITNQIAGTNYTTANQCLTYYAGQTDKVVFNRDYEEIITDGLKFLVDPGFLPSYPRSGTSAYDLITNNVSITLANGVSYSTNDGGTFLYDGANDYIITGTNNLQPSNELTLEVWFESLGNDGGIQGLLYLNYGLGLRLDPNGSIHTRVNSTGSLQQFNTSTTYFNGQWNLVSLTVSTSGFAKLYVNSVFVQQYSISYDGNSPWNTGVGGIGTDINDSAARGMNGYIGPCRVYNRVLSQTEIIRNYDAQKTRFGLM